MRYPKHLILDIRPSQHINHYETTNTITQLYTHFIEIDSSTNFTSEPLTQLKMYPNKSKVSSAYNATVRSAPHSFSFSYNLFDIHFLRKEKLYTKLKYSRCPQYDIVSGGFAAIFAGFIGFLISEKFGIELVDSADFYTAFMYGVFAACSLRPLIRIYSSDNTPYHPLSWKYLYLFVRDLVKLSLVYLKGLYKGKN